MPFLVFAIMMISPLAFVAQDIENDKKVNEICVQKFKKVEEIKQCKAVLLNMEDRQWQIKK